MNSTAQQTNASVVVADAGPLLCAGAISQKQGLNILYQRFTANGIQVLKPRSVHNELRGIANRQGHVGDAARKVTNPKSTGFITLDTTSWAVPDQMTMKALLEAEITRDAIQKGREPEIGPNKNNGEVDALLLAQQYGCILLCNDRAARVLARQLGVRAATFAQVLAAGMRDAQLLAEDVNQYVVQIGDEIHIGTHNTSALAIASLPTVNGL